MKKKYELTDEVNDYGLHRVRYLRDLPCGIEAGDLGGWIEKEENLSQEGNACVLVNAMVFDNARVFENAEVAAHNSIRCPDCQRKKRLRYDKMYQETRAEVDHNAIPPYEPLLSRWSGAKWNVTHDPDGTLNNACLYELEVKFCESMGNFVPGTVLQNTVTGETRKY